MKFKNKKIYMLGIGGIGMSGLALLMKEKGAIVIGSDIKLSKTAKMLQDAGIAINIGHRPENITDDIDLVVYSSAISMDNPEIVSAKNKDITVMQRAKLLAVVSKDFKTIAVSGTHGKTTTTSLLGYILNSLGYEPTVFVGGIPLNFSKNAWLGKDFCVIEADESDGTFLEYSPWCSVITNIDNEHLDHYKSFKNLKQSFHGFAMQTQDTVFGCGDDSYVRDVLKGLKSVKYGFLKNNDIRADNLKVSGLNTIFDLYDGKKVYKNVLLPLVGKHNVLNTLAVIAFCKHIGIEIAEVVDRLKGFKGTSRRFQMKALLSKVAFIDDYAHHPHEIKSVLTTANNLGYKRIVAVLQPHRYSRVAQLFNEFIHCCDSADCIFITDIYSAGEQPIQGITGENLYKKIKKHYKGYCEYAVYKDLPLRVANFVCPGDMVIALGAGDINLAIEKAAKEFKQIVEKKKVG